MTQDNKTEKSSFDEELVDNISHAVRIKGELESLKSGVPLGQAYFAIACALAHVIATKDEVFMQDFRAHIGLEDKSAEVAEGVSND